MIDLKDLRHNPDRYHQGALDKQMTVDINRLLELDEQVRAIQSDVESKRAEQNAIGKEIGPQIGKLKGQLKAADDAARSKLEGQLKELEARPLALKEFIQQHEQQLSTIEAERDAILLTVPQPPDDDVPKGAGEEDNIELRTWHPTTFDPSITFFENKGFLPKSHLELMLQHNMVDFERAVKMSGARHYVLSGDGMRLHQAILRYAFDFITSEHGFRPMSVPVIVREECMVGTGFFPGGRDQAYHIEESRRGAGHDFYLTGTGEVGLMGLHEDEILSHDDLPLKYATVSTCFRREAGAAGKDTAGLYRIHQFDKVEQVVITHADESDSREWHQKMIAIVEAFLQSLDIPYRLLQCCTGDLGMKNADMVDIESWMPSRGNEDADGNPLGAYGETHSASRLYDFQCRRLKLRYRDEDGKIHFCHSLNNTVVASPRILIPIVELYQRQDGSIEIPKVLRPYMPGRDRVGGE